MTPAKQGVTATTTSQTVRLPESPWTRSLQLAWEPNPRVFDRRSQLIEALASVEPVDQFRMGEGSVQVVLQRGHEVSVDVHALGVSILGHRTTSADDAELMVGILSAVNEVLDFRPREARFWFQFLVPWEGESSPGRAFREAATRFISSEVRDWGVHDFALLADGTSQSGRQYQFECGVVEAEDAAPRLARIIGRTTGVTTRQVEELFEMEYPAVSTFVDASWQAHTLPRVRDEIPDWLTSEILESEDEATRLALKIHRRLTTDQEIT